MSNNLRPFLNELTDMVDHMKHRLPCCPNCVNWYKKDELCTLNNLRQRPPAEVIAWGCWAYVGDVPF